MYVQYLEGTPLVAIQHDLQPDSLVHRFLFSAKPKRAAMATFFIGYTSSQVFVMLSVAMYIMQLHLLCISALTVVPVKEEERYLKESQIL